MKLRRTHVRRLLEIHVGGNLHEPPIDIFYGVLVVFETLKEFDVNYQCLNRVKGKG